VCLSRLLVATLPESISRACRVVNDRSSLQQQQQQQPRGNNVGRQGMSPWQTSRWKIYARCLLEVSSVSSPSRGRRTVNLGLSSHIHTFDRPVYTRWCGVAVASYVASTKLLYVEPNYYHSWQWISGSRIMNLSADFHSWSCSVSTVHFFIGPIPWGP